MKRRSFLQSMVGVIGLGAAVKVTEARESNWNEAVASLPDPSDGVEGAWSQAMAFEDGFRAATLAAVPRYPRVPSGSWRVDEADRFRGKVGKERDAYGDEVRAMARYRAAQGNG